MDIPSYLIGAIKGAKSAGVKYVVVNELPSTGEEGTIYLVPKSTSQTDNVYNEYMYINENWELIGDTQADLSDYLQESDLKTINGQSVVGSGNIDTEIIQYSTLPTASATNEGKIVQYIGTTTNDYTNGYYYKCVSDGQDPATYSWENINVQAGGSSTMSVIEQDTYIQDLSTGAYYVKDGIKILCAEATGGRGFWFYNTHGNSIAKNPMILFIEGKTTNNNVEYITFKIIGNYITYKIDLSQSNIGWSSSQLIIDGYCKADKTANGALYLYQPLFSMPSNYGYSYYMSANNDTLMNKGMFNTFLDALKYQKTNDIYTLSGINEYSTSTTYAVGDYVWRNTGNVFIGTYNYKIYKCNTADTTGNWDASKWDEKTYLQYLQDTLVGTALGGSY